MIVWGAKLSSDAFRIAANGRFAVAASAPEPIDMGGNAALDEDLAAKGLNGATVVVVVLPSSFFENPLNGEGAAFDVGGNAALLDEGLVAKGLNGVAVFVVVLLSIFIENAPKGLGAVDVGGKPSVLDAANVFFASSLPPPNENPPVLKPSALPPVEGSAPPNPPVPMLPDANGLASPEATEDLPSSPAFGV